MSIVSFILLTQLKHFLKDSQPILHLVIVFDNFSLFSEIQPNLTKSKIAEIKASKRVQVAVCGIKPIKVLRIHFTYDNTIKEEYKFLIAVFESSAMSTIVFEPLTDSTNLISLCSNFKVFMV